jgi:hypothetical protein
MADETGGQRRGKRHRPPTIDVTPEASAPPEPGPEDTVKAAAATAPEAAVAPEPTEPAAQVQPAPEMPPVEPSPVEPSPQPTEPVATAPADPVVATVSEPVIPPAQAPSAAAGPTADETPPRRPAEVEPAPLPPRPEPVHVLHRAEPSPATSALPPAADPAPPPRNGMAPALLGGLIAATVVLALGIGASLLGLIGPSGGRVPDVAPLAQRIAALEAQRSAPAANGQPAPALAELTARIATVESVVAELQSRGTPAAAHGGATTPPVPATDGTLRADLDTLREFVRGLETRLAATPPQGATDEARAERERLAASVAELGTALTAVQQRVAGLDLAPVRTELTRLADEVRRLASAPPSALERNAALVIAAEALERAVARGEAFAAELTAVRSLGLQGVDFVALEARAASGVPSRAALTARFRAQARAVIAAAQPAPDGAVGRLMQSVGGLVSVRPSGEPAGEGVGATVARIETRLANGELAAALTDFRSLPAQAQSAAGSFGEDLAARVAAEGLVDRIKSDILRGAARG